MKKIINQKGFGLVEILVSLIALGLVVFATSDLLLHTFQNTTKSELVSQINQNGQSVLTSLTNQITQADQVVCMTDDSDNPENTIGPLSTPPPPATSFTVLTLKIADQYVRYHIVSESVAQAAAHGQVNGYIAVDYPAVASDPTTATEANNVCNFDTSQGNGYAPTNLQYLTNTNTSNGVSVEYGYFQVTSTSDGSPSGSPSDLRDFQSNNQANRPVVSVYFTLKQAAGAGTHEESQIGDGIDFSTSRQLR